MTLRAALLAAALLASGCASGIQRSRALDPARPMPVRLGSQVVTYELGLFELGSEESVVRGLEGIGEQLLPRLGAILADHGVSLRLSTDGAAPFLPPGAGDGGSFDQARWFHPLGTTTDMTSLEDEERAEVIAGLGAPEGQGWLAVRLELELDDGAADADLHVKVYGPDGRVLLRAYGGGKLLVDTTELPPRMDHLATAADRALRDLTKQDVTLVD